MDKRTAEGIVESLLASYKGINEVVSGVFAEGPYRQAVEFRSLAGQLMGHIATGFFMPLFREFPELEPAEFRTTYTPPPPLPRERIVALEQRLEELASRVTFIEANLRANRTPADLAMFNPELATLRETLELGRKFAARALAMAEAATE